MFLIFIILFPKVFYFSESIFKLMISSVLLRSFLSAQSKPRRRRSFERGWKTKGKQSHLLKSYFSRSKIVHPAISYSLWIPPIPLPMILAPTCSHLLIPPSSILERFRRGFPFLFRRETSIDWNRDGGRRRRSARRLFLGCPHVPDSSR